MRGDFSFQFFLYHLKLRDYYMHLFAELLYILQSIIQPATLRQHDIFGHRYKISPSIGYFFIIKHSLYKQRYF